MSLLRTKLSASGGSRQARRPPRAKPAPKDSGQVSVDAKPWVKKRPVAATTTRVTPVTTTRVETRFMPSEPHVPELTAHEKAWLKKRLDQGLTRLDELGLSARLPARWTLQLEKTVAADQPTFSTVNQKYSVQVSMKMLAHEDETVLFNGLGQHIAQLTAGASLQDFSQLREALGDVFSGLLTGAGHVGGTDYRASMGHSRLGDDGIALRYITDEAAKTKPLASAAGHVRTLAALPYQGDETREGSVLTSRFLFHVRAQPAIKDSFSSLLVDSLRDLGKWVINEAGQQPLQSLHEGIFRSFGANRAERVDAIFELHLMAAFLLRAAKTEGQRAVIQTSLEARGGKTELIEAMLQSINGAAARRQERINSSPINQRLVKMDFSSVRDAKPLTKENVERLAVEWSQKLHADVTVDWNNPATGMAVHPSRGNISIPRGLIEYPGLTADGLALLVSHEAAHAHGIWNEAAADDYAVRHGLRALWGADAFSGPFPERAFRAAFSASLKLSQLNENAFSVVTQEPVRFTENSQGYLVPQSRWDIFREGIMGRKTPYMR